MKGENCLLSYGDQCFRLLVVVLGVLVFVGKRRIALLAVMNESLGKWVFAFDAEFFLLDCCCQGFGEISSILVSNLMIIVVVCVETNQ